MAQSLSKILAHLIFSTKKRERIIQDDIREELHRYMGGVLKDLESPAVIINSVEDRVHILFSASKNHSASKIVERVKTASSKWIKSKTGDYANFHWQNGYGIFSVSQSNAAEVRRYIENQGEHHRRKTFEEEFREFLHRHEVSYEEKYVWD